MTTGLKLVDTRRNGRYITRSSIVLVKLFAHALIATSAGHEAALEELKKDIESQKKMSALN